MLDVLIAFGGCDVKVTSLYIIVDILSGTNSFDLEGVTTVS